MNRNTIESKETEQMMSDWYVKVSGDTRMNPAPYGSWDIALKAKDNWYVEVKGLGYTRDEIQHFRGLFCPTLKLQTLTKMTWGGVLVAYTSKDGWVQEIPVDPLLPYPMKDIALVQGRFSTTITNYVLPQVGKWSKVCNEFPVAKERWSKKR